MKLKMSPNSLFAILLRSPWWISMLVTLVFVLASLALLPAAYVPFGMMGGVPFLVIGLLAAKRQWNVLSPARVDEVLAQAAAMSLQEFLAALEAAYAAHGYTVARPRGAAADLRLEKGGVVTLVTCRRWKAATHGTEALRPLSTEREAQDVPMGVYISLSGVTDGAQRFATANGILPVSGPALATLLAGKGR